MELEKIKDNILCMFNLANNDAAAEGEADNALRFAKRLMDQYNLSEDDLDTDPEIALERAEFARQRVDGDSSRIAAWERDLARLVCGIVGGVEYYSDRPQDARNAVGGYVLDDNGKRKQVSGIVFYGISEEIDFAEEWYTALRTKIAGLAKLKYGGVFRGSGRVYCEAFVAGRAERLELYDAEQKEIAATEGGSALVVIERRNALVDRKRELAGNWLRDVEGIKLRTLSRSSAGNCDRDAWEQGKRDGRECNLEVSQTLKLTHQKCEALS